MLSLEHAHVGAGKRLMALLLLPILCLCKPLSAQEANGYVAGEVLVGIPADSTRGPKRGILLPSVSMPVPCRTRTVEALWKRQSRLRGRDS